jgi:hypothetical protein
LTHEHKKKLLEISDLFLNDNNDLTESTLKALSPFTKYFKRIVDNLDMSVNLETDNNNDDVVMLSVNENYIPEFLKLIENQLHLLPLWSGIMLDFVKMQSGNLKTIGTNISNNYVENWFSQIKKNILYSKDQSKLTTHQLAVPLFKHLKSKYYLHYNREVMIFKRKFHLKICF